MIMSAAAPLRVLVAGNDEAARALLAEQLTTAGHEVVAQAATGAEAVTRALALGPDVVLLDVAMPEGLGTDAAAIIARMEPAPGVVLLTGDPDLTLSDEDIASSHAFCVLPDRTPSALMDVTVRLAAARAKEMAVARADAAATRRRLEERKVVERAKGILMRRTGSSEAEAYRILQRSSQDRATPMVKLAQAVIDSEPGAN